jgi:hypothetical protein
MCVAVVAPKQPAEASTKKGRVKKFFTGARFAKECIAAGWAS